MTPEDVRQRQCNGKKKFTESEAKRNAKLMHKRIKAKFRAYACNFCPFWHIGTVRSAGQGRRRAERRGVL